MFTSLLARKVSEQTVDSQVICDIMILMWHHSNLIFLPRGSKQLIPDISQSFPQSAH